ncbi:MAG: insulinase family protein [Candidatus Didemnitutus sp.]|nr:insulinase family protein [Candidatus Didemnitutus sp.]
MKRKALLFSVLGLLSSVLGAAAHAQIAAGVTRTRIAGLDVVAYKTGVKDVVYLRGSLPAGDNKAPADNVMLPTLVGGMLERGTTKHTKNEIADQLEAVGASINFSVGSHMVEFSARCLAKDVPLVVSLLAEQLREPAFTEEEFNRLKQQTVGGLQRALESTDFRATDEFSRAAFSPGHPNHNATIDQRIAATQSAQLEDLKKFHAEHYGPAHLTLVAAGDLDVAALQGELAKSFTGWTGGTAPLPTPKSAPTDAAKEQTVFMPGKTSVNIVIGQSTGMRYGETDNIALRAGTAILGSGFTGRLMANVRDKEGLTYGIGASLGNDTFADGDWKITATFAPALLEKGIASAKRQLNLWYQDGVTADELARRQDNLVGSFQVGLSTTEGLTQTLLTTLHRGKDLGWIDRYPQIVRSLTVEQVNGAIKKHLNPDEMFLIKAGTVPGAAPAAK